MKRQTFQYNFRIGPESALLIGTTVLGSFVVDIGGRILGLAAWPTLDTWGAWGAAASLGAVRTGIGVLLAVITGGGFQKPGESGPPPPAQG